MKKKAPIEQRKYLRISSVLPVEFSLIDERYVIVGSYQQGFTNNISKSGICLVVNDLSGDAAEKYQKGVLLSLQIDLPFKRQAACLTGKIVWKEINTLPRFRQLRLGIEFIDLKQPETHLVFNYAITKKSILPAVFLIIAIIGIFSARLWLKEQKLIVSNTRLVRQHKILMDEIAWLSERVGQEKTRSDTEQKRFEALAVKIAELEKDYALAPPDKRVNLKKEIAALTKEKDFVGSALTERKQARAVLLKAMQAKEHEKTMMDTRVVGGMYNWIKSRQNLKTGLILSYEGDDRLKNISYTYDQALAVIALLREPGNEGRARQILDFYLAQVQAGKPIYNAYYTDDGTVNEYVMHSGVYAWVGLATLHYFRATQDAWMLELAERVADFLESQTDVEGGLIGGPGLTWYSTEHNLDALAFFRMLYQATGRDKYLKLSERIRTWIDTYAYTRKDIPINRGKGDATIATDTYTWSITAIGPGELSRLSMDPEKIIEFAVENCEVETSFFRKQGSITVKGFDFSKFTHSARGGVVSCEWTAQMILALQIMAVYYQERDQKKYEDYLQKIILYASELQKMIINTPSHSGKAYPALPYASDANVDTGHGWRTPLGNEIGSLASTAYFLFAYEGWNPLTAEALPLSLKSIFQKKAKEIYLMLEQPRPSDKREKS